jgi:hypothetical protein
LIFFDLRIMETEVAIIRKANTIMINRFCNVKAIN